MELISLNLTLVALWAPTRWIAFDIAVDAESAETAVDVSATAVDVLVDVLATAGKV